MLQVTKLIGEGFDFATGRDITLGIAVSNGKVEAIIPIDELSAKVIIQLFKDAVDKRYPSAESEKEQQDGQSSDLDEGSDEYQDETTGASSI